MHLDQENSSDMTAGQSPEWHDIQFDDPDEHDLQLHGGKGQRPDRQQHGRGDWRENHVSVRLVEAAGQRLQCGGAAGESAALVRRLHLRRLWESDGHDRQRRGALAQRIGECGDQPDFAYQHFVRWEWERDQFGPSGSLTTMAYNVANRMATVNSTNAYAYDPASQRVYFRNSAGTETLYVYGTGGKKLATYTIAGITGSQVNFTMQSQNVYFGGKLISTEGNAVAVDRLGSVRWNAASGGHTYYPYGVEYSATTNDTEKYATYTRDTLTGLDYAKNRYYSSTWGRFMAPDPSHASMHLQTPLSWNRYTYTLGDPIGGNDPRGLDSDDDGDDGCPDGQMCFFGGGSGGGSSAGWGGGGDGDVGPSTVGVGSDGSQTVIPDTPPCFSSSGEACGGTYTFGSGDDPLNPTAQTVFGLVGQQMDGLPGLISEGTGAAILASTGIPTLAALGSTAVVALAGTGAVAAGATEAQYGFYSGLGAQQAAEAWQSSTAGAQLMSQLPPGVDPGAASASYAQSVSGTLQIFQSTVLEVGGTPSAWAGSEYPALLGNQNVTGTVINLTNAAGQVVSSTPTPWPWWP